MSLRTSSAAASARRAAEAVDSAPSTGVLFMRFWVTSFADSGIWNILLAPSLSVTEQVKHLACDLLASAVVLKTLPRAMDAQHLLCHAC